MSFYLTAHLALLFLGLYYETLNSKDLRSVKKRVPNYFFTIPSFVLLFIISAFRGDFTTDYKNYTMLFHRYNQYEFWDALRLTSTETGYIFLSRLIGVFTDNEVVLFAVVSFVILICFYSQINKQSTYIWLSVLMFVTIGSFYSSFNIMRQILATAIIFAGSKFLYERNFFKYLLVVMLATLFHQSSLIMIGFYFLLNLRINLRNLLVMFLGATGLMLSFDIIISVVQTYFYTSYTDSAYGMTGASFNIAILPLAILVFCMFNVNKLDSSDMKQKVWLNAVIFYALFSLLSTQVYMAERLTHFFAPYALLLVPYIISRINPPNKRLLFMTLFISLMILYHLVVFSGTQYDPFYFIWESL